VTHVVVVMKENRSFDHLFGGLPSAGIENAEVWPSGFTSAGNAPGGLAPYHLLSTCVSVDPPHQWGAMHDDWDHGKMDGFLSTAETVGPSPAGTLVMGYYEAADLPFYYWLASTFALGDHHFTSVLSGTWPNRDYLYAGTSNGVQSTWQATFSGTTIFDALDTAGVAWGFYVDGGAVGEGALGWTANHRGVHPLADLKAGLADGSLPSVVFVDSRTTDEHPTRDLQAGEAWTRAIYEEAIASPLWPELAMIVTYDESGGFFDHVAPPSACPPSPDQAAFDQLGIRVPLVVVSPYARASYVSHVVHEHASILRFIELLNGIPALTARDANADALLDMFDFIGLPNIAPPPAPAAGTGGCSRN